MKLYRTVFMYQHLLSLVPLQIFYVILIVTHEIENATLNSAIERSKRALTLYCNGLYSKIYQCKCYPPYKQEKTTLKLNLEIGPLENLIYSAENIFSDQKTCNALLIGMSSGTRNN